MTQQQDGSGVRGSGWQAGHAGRDRETNGADGHIWRGVPALLLTTEVGVQVQAERFQAWARTASPEEKPGL